MLLRILASIFIIFSILFLPFYISIILAIGAMLYFAYFFEAVVLFFILDLLHGVKENKLLGITFISLIISIVLILIIEFLKKKLKNHF